MFEILSGFSAISQGLSRSLRGGALEYVRPPGVHVIATNGPQWLVREPGQHLVHQSGIFGRGVVTERLPGPVHPAFGISDGCLPECDRFRVQVPGHGVVG